MDPVWRTYLVVNAADWLLVTLLLIVAVRWFELPMWAGLALLAAWIGKDLVLFPRVRRYYEPEPAERRIVGEDGEALTAIDPEGFARVHGEIWQVRAADASAPIVAGTRVLVRDVQGLQLVVEPRSGSRASTSGKRLSI
jgi:membrane protein implicated in regulation of membrane protease activity